MSFVHRRATHPRSVSTSYDLTDITYLTAYLSQSTINLALRIGPQPVTYGSEIMLVDQATGTQSGPLQIRKVDKSRVAPDDGGPVSQMQKIALLRVNPDGSHQYLSAAGPLPGSTVAVPPAPGLPNNGGAHQLLYQTARVREEVKDGSRIVIDEVDDYLCWTIVGICT